MKWGTALMRASSARQSNVGAPLLDGVAEVGVRGAVVPVVDGGRLRQPGAGEALHEVVELGLGDLDAEGADVGGSGGVRHVFDATVHIGTFSS